MITTDSKIIIIGGGVFGLSSALWLARDGYKNITIFDRCAFDKNFYDPENGCDGASADINKVFRMAYGHQSCYQNLAIEAKDIWLSWNKAIAEGAPHCLPDGLTPDDKLLDICGCYLLADGRDLQDYYYADKVETAGKTENEFHHMCFFKNTTEDKKRLQKINPDWVAKYHSLDSINNGDTNGYLDMNSGITIADKACVYARFLCEKAGVKFVLGDPHGKIKNLIFKGDAPYKKAIGVNTCDGKSHFGDLVVVAAGSWTCTILPEAHRTVEATAGTVLFTDIPKDRQDLWERFHPNNFPVWSYIKGYGDDFFEGVGFPITKEGRMKFGFRGRKYTKFQAHPTNADLRISIPQTKYSENAITTVPLYALSKLKEVVVDAFPELAQLGFSSSRLCWYTDSIDNDYVIDYVPGYSDSLFICTGGSGHGFKFLPILGRHVKNQLERKEDQFTSIWKWRVAKVGEENNGLSEGEDGPRELTKLEMATPTDFKFQTPPKL